MTCALRILLASALALVTAFSALSAHAAFTDNGDGTITDTVTGLMWDKCAYGQFASDCSGGAAARRAWSQALTDVVALNGAVYKGHNDWRLPNVKELESLVKIDSFNVAIDGTAFPNTDGSFPYWSSTLFVPPMPTFAGQVWDVDFNSGVVDIIDTSRVANNSFVRIVRSGNAPAPFDLLASSATTPVLATVVSRRTHGAAGPFDLPLTLVAPPNVNHNPATEPRVGPVQTIVFTFDKPLNAATAAVTEGTATAGAPTFTGNSVVVSLTGVSDQQYVTVSLSNVASTDGGVGGGGSVRVGFLAGDVNQSRQVTVADVGTVNASILQALTNANFTLDINGDGKITVADKGLTNANLLKKLLTP